MQIVKGIPTSHGIVYGNVYIVRSPGSDDVLYTSPRRIASAARKTEIARFKKAVEETRKYFIAARKELAGKAGMHNARILDAQVLLLEDKDFLAKVEKEVSTQLVDAESAVVNVTRRYLKVFDDIQDDYLRERSADVKDVVRRLLNTLTGNTRRALETLEEDVIVIAHDLSPSQTATMNKEHVIGIVTEVGGPTSHTSILARALEVPAVSGAQGIIDVITDDDYIIVDGYNGLVIINPYQKQIDEYRTRREKAEEQKALLLQQRNQPAITTDEHSVALLANIEFPEEVAHARDMGAEGIGLYRTEFLYMNRTHLPTEEMQFETYAKVIEAAHGAPVTIRTLDLGGDKFASALKVAPEMNPSMGWRAIRMCLERRDIFTTQLRAILRASVLGNVRIMFPLITHVNEIRAAKAVLQETITSLREEDIPCNDAIEIGAMIEVPSAALCADMMAQEVDFFSIGTNDLIQYTLAIDRANEKTAQMYDPMNQAVLRLLHMIIDAAHGRKCSQKECDECLPHPACMMVQRTERRPIRVAVCGEIAATPMMAFLLVGMGVDELSMAATSIPECKDFIRSMSYETARTAVRDALQCATSDEVCAVLRQYGVSV